MSEQEAVDQALSYLALHWLTYPEVMLDMRLGKMSGAALMRPQHAIYRLLWEAATQSYDATKKPPTVEQLMFFAEPMIRNDMMIIDKGRAIDEVRRVITTAFDMRMHEQLNKEFIYSQRLINTVLDELVINPAVRAFGGSGAEGDDRAAMLDRLNQLIATVGSVGVRSADVFDMAKLSSFMRGADLEITGVRFYDELFGGIPRGSFNGMLALTGHGKTTFGIQLAVSVALLGRRVKFYTYEQPVFGNLTRRFVAMAAGVPVPHDCVDPRSLPKDAFDRLSKIAPVLRENLEIIDMSGATAGQGSGGVREFCDMQASAAAGEQSTRPALSIVDWFGTMIEKDSTNDDRSKYDRMKNALALFNESSIDTGTSTMLLHQIKPEAALRYDPTKIMPDQEAEDCKGFSQLQYNCMTFGKRDDETKGMLAAASKARSGALKPFSIVRLNGPLSCIDCATAELTFNDDRGPRDPYFRSKKTKAVPNAYSKDEPAIPDSFPGM